MASSRVAHHKNPIGIDRECFRMFGQVPNCILAVDDAVTYCHVAVFFCQAVRHGGDRESFIDQPLKQDLKGPAGRLVAITCGPASAVCEDNHWVLFEMFAGWVVQIQLQLSPFNGFVNDFELASPASFEVFGFFGRAQNFVLRIRLLSSYFARRDNRNQNGCKRWVSHHR